MRRRLVLAIGIVALAASRPARADLAVTFTTTPSGGVYAPKNIVAVWIEGPAGFVKTIGRWAGVRASHLVAWAAASGEDADAVSGATRLDHAQPLSLRWDLRDRAAVVVPDGTYTLRMELADENAATPGENNQGAFTFVKGPAPATLTTAGGGFADVVIDFAPLGLDCDNGVLDPGETCDPPGTCPTTCAAGSDACAPVELVGEAATCTAICRPAIIAGCLDADGCCPSGCSAATDSDCTAPGPGPGGGCAATGGGASPSLMLSLAAIAALLARRRRGRRARAASGSPR